MSTFKTRREHIKYKHIGIIGFFFIGLSQSAKPAEIKWPLLTANIYVFLLLNSTLSNRIDKISLKVQNFACVPN